MDALSRPNLRSSEQQRRDVATDLVPGGCPTARTDRREMAMMITDAVRRTSDLTSRYFETKALTAIVGGTLADQPGLGHNRWHPDVTSAIEIDAGEEVILESLDVFGGQVTEKGSTDELRDLDTSGAHPLTGPVYVGGARPGDLLDVEILGVEPLSGFAHSHIFPGTPGILGEKFPDGFRSTWYAKGSIAESPQVPGVRIPAQPHPGTIGVAPSHELLRVWNEREAAVQHPGHVWPRTAENAHLRGVPAAQHATAARTQPPRENGGNMDINRLGAGARVLFPVFVEGGLLSLGDHHLSAGDGECSYNAMEMDGRSWLRINVIKDGVAKHNVRTPIVRPAPLGWNPSPDRYLGFTGFSFSDTEQGFQDSTMAMREAMLQAVDYLMSAGFSGEQAYVILSAAPIQIHISCIVTQPNASVTLYLPLDIFDKNILPVGVH
jgi:formamidase